MPVIACRDRELDVLGILLQARAGFYKPLLRADEVIE